MIFFTLGISLPVINVNPTLGDDRDLPIDFFGFNGGNTIQVDANDDPVQTWEILYNNEVVLANPAATILRVPFGTLSNFADWRTGWPILERDLPFDWFYDKNSFKKYPPAI
ncbi:MAG: hypothetical protein IPM91_21345 [Bacteroidetes bacterium]|nr:hypothetical protein [Bacteroidota bacterium]